MTNGGMQKATMTDQIQVKNKQRATDKVDAGRG